MWLGSYHIPFSLPSSTRPARTAGSFRAATRSARVGSCISAFHRLPLTGVIWARPQRLPLGRVWLAIVIRPTLALVSARNWPNISMPVLPLLPAPPLNSTSPHERAISRSSSISCCGLVAKSLTAWNRPPPPAFIPSAMARYSSIGASVPGT